MHEVTGASVNQRAVKITGRVSKVRISESTFANLTAVSAAAIKLDSAGEVLIENCLFQNNSADLGAAVEVKSSGPVTFSHNTFRANQARKINGEEVNLIRDAATLRGGAIYIDNVESLLCFFCGVVLKNQNTFVDNYAEIQGGAISYRSSGFQDVDGSTVFINNTAGVHSDTVSSFST